MGCNSMRGKPVWSSWGSSMVSPPLRRQPVLAEAVRWVSYLNKLSAS